MIMTTPVSFLFTNNVPTHELAIAELMGLQCVLSEATNATIGNRKGSRYDYNRIPTLRLGWACQSLK